MEFAGFVIGVLGLVFGGFQLRQARRADARRSKQLASLQSDITTLRVVLEPGQEPHTTAATEVSELQFAAVQFADVDNDGDIELVVQHYYGAHGSMLRVYGWTGFDFAEKAHLITSAPAGFTVADIDGDGQIEVATAQGDYGRPDPDNPGATLPYAAGAQTEQLWRMEDGEWGLIGARELALPRLEGDQWVRAEYHWHTDPPVIPVSAFDS